MNGALVWRALTMRCAPNTTPRVQSLRSAILNAEALPSELTAYEIALNRWPENIREWETTSGANDEESSLQGRSTSNGASTSPDAELGHRQTKPWQQ